MAETREQETLEEILRELVEKTVEAHEADLLDRTGGVAHYAGRIRALSTPREPVAWGSEGAMERLRAGQSAVVHATQESGAITVPLYAAPPPEGERREDAEILAKFIVGWWPGLEDAFNWPDPEESGRGKRVYEAARRLLGEEGGG